MNKLRQNSQLTKKHWNVGAEDGGGGGEDLGSWPLHFCNPNYSPEKFIKYKTRNHDHPIYVLHRWRSTCAEAAFLCSPDDLRLLLGGFGEDNGPLLSFPILVPLKRCSSQTLAQEWKTRRSLPGASRDGRDPAFFSGQRPQRWQKQNKKNWNRLFFFSWHCPPFVLHENCLQRLITVDTRLKIEGGVWLWALFLLCRRAF